MVTAFQIPFLTLTYLGIKDGWKYLYQAPKLAKKVKNYSEWEEIRYRYPSPGNDPVNGELTHREIRRTHFKTPYWFSPHYVRNYWNKNVEGTRRNDHYFAPALDTMTPQQEASVLRYKEGDEAGNKQKKDRYLRAKAIREAKSDLKEMKDLIEEAKVNPIAVYHKNVEFIQNFAKHHDWMEVGDVPGGSPYQVTPDTFIMEYLQYHVSSYEMQLYLEIEKYMEDFRDHLEDKGTMDIYEGNSENWKILDSHHRPDQQIETVKSLKQRNVKELA